MIAAPFGGAWRLEIHDTLGSTSDEVIARAAAGEPGSLAVLARRQSKGRGTGHKIWRDGVGNLALSVLLRPDRAIATPGELGIRAAVALHEVLSREIGQPTALRIKWPNDILLDGRKLAGILVETAIGVDGAIAWACIGLGANLASAPAVDGVRTASLAEAGAFCDPVQVATSLLGLLTGKIEQPFHAVRDAWSARAHRLGEPLVVQREGSETVRGRFVGLGERGELLLDADAGRLAVSNGSVATAAVTAPCL